ncbi:MAG TPA: efflux RND transporter periplasmic adaptor subunit [Thermoanaerobaculia bacterium]|nr:efflux RND transporter periplasmic adaptor subunit [Thermoanaerobaculia bacterium]
MSSPASSRPRGQMFFSIAGVAAALAAGLGIANRVHDRSKLRDRTIEAAAPIVSVVQPKPGDPQRELVLPGNVEAFTDAPIYARTSGYLKAWFSDIGATVKKGQLLATIDAPEVDQQLQQARAQENTAMANEQLATLTADRASKLVDTNAISRQEYDNAISARDARRAELASARANVGRLEQLVGFQRIEAPFAGTITARETDVGQLVDAGSNGAGHELFRIASTDKLRVYIGVPQARSTAAIPGVEVDLTLSERPGKTYRGVITRTSNAIDPVTRTLRVEVDLDNPRGEILPGAYAQVHLKPADAVSALLVPASALLFRAEGPRVAVVDDASKVNLAPVTLGRDFGTQVEVVDGLKATDRIIDNPPDAILQGQLVRVAAPAAPPAPKT